MDLQMPGLDGIAATRSVRAELPDCQVIALTTFDDDENVFEGLRASAIGCLLKDVPPEKLFEAIRLSARGESFIQPSVARKVVVEFARLSERRPQARKLELELLSEREVLQLVTNGASNKEIATKLFIAPGTVKNHITNGAKRSRRRDSITKSGPQAAPQTIGVDESPAGYSLASCSPAALASASPADGDSG